MVLMTKSIEIKADNIRKAKDQKYVFETYENIIESIMEFDCASKLAFNKDKDSFLIDFDLKICKSADILWILIKEWLSTIAETEEFVKLSIIEQEQKGIKMIFNIQRYIPCHQLIE